MLSSQKGFINVFALRFMESLGPMVSFFSQKVQEKVVLIRELSLRHSAEANGKPAGLQTPEAFGLKTGVSLRITV